MSKFCDLTGQVAIVTGASSGIGRASALALTRQGAKVTLVARRVKRLEEIKKEIEKMGGEALVVKTDVLVKDEIENMVKKTVEKWSRVDILLNNAGIAIMKPFLELTQEDWDRTLEVNLRGQFLCAQAVAREMKKQKSGRIINVASVASGQQGIGTAGAAHYCASKGGVTALTEALAVELAPFNINVNCIAPGLIETEMTEGILRDEQMKKALLTKIPKGRPGKVEEIANVVVFLASHEAEYVNGVMWVVDGGWLAG
jgi:NAD(P)-dependent dehydrogenase (short-subunit alcohol dehydrogenase family)